MACVVAVVAVVVAAAMPAAAQSSSTTTGVPTVRVGVNDPKDPNIAVLQYLPAKVTVAAGGTLDFSWAGTIEPHSVTFLAPGQQLPPPGSDPSLFAPTPPAGPYDGAAFVNSGLLPFGPTPPPTLSMTFATPGEYQYYCVIHPTMVGTVDVVASGAGTTAAQAEATGKAEEAKWLAEGRKAKRKLVASARAAEPVEGSGGLRTWTVEMGTTTPHTDVLAFAPTPRRVKAGDSVVFVNNSEAPHTATFNGSQPPITNPLDPLVGQQIPGPSPQALNPTDRFKCGELAPNAAAPGEQSPA